MNSHILNKFNENRLAFWVCGYPDCDSVLAADSVEQKVVSLIEADLGLLLEFAMRKGELDYDYSDFTLGDVLKYHDENFDYNEEWPALEDYMICECDSSDLYQNSELVLNYVLGTKKERWEDFENTADIYLCDGDSFDDTWDEYIEYFNICESAHDGMDLDSYRSYQYAMSKDD